MPLDYNELEKEGLIRKLPVDKKKVEDTLKLAERDLKTAKKILSDNTDWGVFHSIQFHASGWKSIDVF